jgi:hypothetical protein
MGWFKLRPQGVMATFEKGTDPIAPETAALQAGYSQSDA